MNEFATVFVTEEFIENGCLVLFPHRQAFVFLRNLYEDTVSKIVGEKKPQTLPPIDPGC